MAIPIGRVVLPGDKFPEISEHDDLKLGRGLVLIRGYPVAIKTGVLKHKPPLTYWIDSPDTFYQAKTGDNIIGIVVHKLRDIYRVNINQAEPAILPYLSFDNASKRNRPDVEIGDAVYAKIIKSERNVQTELSCLNVNFNGIYGKLDSDGMLYRGHVNYIRRLLSHKNKFMNTMGELIPFEVAIGVNGRISVNGRSSLETMKIYQVIKQGEYLRDDEFFDYAKSILA